jgi:hypothetical protein
VSAVRFLAIILTGLALIAPAAHLFEYRRKIVMPADEYFVVQNLTMRCGKGSQGIIDNYVRLCVPKTSSALKR